MMVMVVTLHVAQTVNTEQLKHCIPYKHVLFSYVIVNTVHKGDYYCYWWWW